MRVLLVNWAKVWDGATRGGGANGYTQALALTLAKRGHDVTSLCAGVSYTPDGRCLIRRHPDWFGIRVLEVVNSPVLAPAIAQFKDPLGEVGEAELEAAVSQVYRQLKPDIVHFQNIEGLTAGCVRAAGQSGAAVVYSLHNYHTICPQVYLMQGHRTPCRSFEDGRACERCIDARDPREEREDRVREMTSKPLEPAPGAAASVRPRTPPRLKLWPWSAREEEPAPPTAPGAPVPGEPMGDLSLPMLHAGPDPRGKSSFLVGELTPRKWPSPLDPEWAPLDNEATPDPCTPGASSPFARRRAAMVEMLSGCDAVLAVSEFVRKKFVALGVRSDRVRTMAIGTWANHVAARHRELVFDPPPFEPTERADRARPIRLVFMGYNHWYKGLPMLADALELLVPEVLRRYHLTVFALGGESIEWRFRRLEPRLAGLAFAHGYEYHDIPYICGGKDLGLVPSVWWDNAPQTVFEFFACGVPVLGARLGGIPDFVKHGENGLLFRGNDRYDLARRLVEVAREPWRLNALRAGVRPHESIEGHTAALELVYRDCVSSGSGRASGA